MSPARAVRETPERNDVHRQFQNSPENARCSCGNNTHFIGSDHRGYGGPEECECGAAEHNEEAPTADFRECICMTVLTQPYVVLRDAGGDVVEYDYEAFAGGGWDAQIGEYTKIKCARCDAEVYRAPDLTDSEAVE